MSTQTISVSSGAVSVEDLARTINEKVFYLLTPQAEIGLARVLERLTPDMSDDDDILALYIEWRRVEFCYDQFMRDEFEKAFLRELLVLPGDMRRILGRHMLDTLQRSEVKVIH